MFRHYTWWNFRKKSTTFIQMCRCLHVLGVESSCDDAAVSIINWEARKILADRRSADSASWERVGGVLPFASATHHRAVLDRLTEEALADARLRASDVDAVAVSTRPGIVIALKVGIEHAIAFARNFRRPLVPVHHMRAHALVARLLYPSLAFPFATLLVSGAHCLICLVRGPSEFHILADCSRGSPGECLDKLARQLKLSPHNGSFGAALEIMAKRCPAEQITRFSLTHQKANGIDFDFDTFKSRYLLGIGKARKRWESDENELAEWCAGIQHSLAELICARLDAALACLNASGCRVARKLIVAGGVARNAYFLERFRQTAARHAFDLGALPAHLCTDNGVMVAVAGAEIFTERLANSMEKVEEGEEGEDTVHWPNALPDSIWAQHKVPIGIRWEEGKWIEHSEEGRREEKATMEEMHGKNIMERQIVAKSLNC